MTALRTFARWYWNRLKDMGVFAAGYVTGAIVVGFLTQAPAFAHAVLNWARP